MIVDAQVHVWAASTAERPWNPGGADYAHGPELSAQHLLGEMDRVGVDRALLVSPTWEGWRNDLVLEATSEHPDRFGTIVRFDVSDRSNATHLEGWKADPRILGARLVFFKQWVDWMRDGTADWFWPLAEDLSFPVMVFAPGQYSEIAAVAERHPGLRLTLCHLGLNTALRDAEIVSEIDRLLPLADYPNVAVKVTSLPSFVTESFPYPMLQDQIRRVVEAFGPQRAFWGSDLSRLRGDYAEVYRLFTEELDFVDDDDLDWIMGKAVCSWFDWALD
jgi:predicted TIM-barrel fold metal-dependent hydrolase